MRCSKCGARVGKRDLYCSRCANPLRKESQHIYKDSFIRQPEESSHALMITVSILLVIALIAGAVLLLYHYPIWKMPKPQGPETVSEQGAPAPAAEGQEIAAAGEEGNGNGAAPAGPQAQTETEEKAQAETETGKETETETETETESGTAAQSGTPEGRTLDRAADIMAQKASGVTGWAVYVYDLQGGHEYMAGSADKPMYLSACISVPILYAAAHLLDGAVITLNDTIVYENSIGGRGEANPEERQGQPFPLTYYLTTMLSYSDNNCMNSLMTAIGREKINEICHGAGFASVDLQRSIVADVTDGSENYCSARDLGQMVKQLYNGKFRTIGRSFLERYFRIDEYDPVATLIGQPEKVGGAPLFLNQNGRGDTRFCETAVVGDADASYVICVMIMGESGYSCDEAVAEISAYVYDMLTTQE